MLRPSSHSGRGRPSAVHGSGWWGTARVAARAATIPPDRQGAKRRRGSLLLPGSRILPPRASGHTRPSSRPPLQCGPPALGSLLMELRGLAPPSLCALRFLRLRSSCGPVLHAPQRREHSVRHPRDVQAARKSPGKSFLTCQRRRDTLRLLVSNGRLFQPCTVTPFLVTCSYKAQIQERLPCATRCEEGPETRNRRVGKILEVLATAVFMEFLYLSDVSAILWRRGRGVLPCRRSRENFSALSCFLSGSSKGRGEAMVDGHYVHSIYIHHV